MIRLCAIAVLLAGWAGAGWCDEAPVAAEPLNLAENPGFEERMSGAIHLPARWDPFSVGDKVMVALVTEPKRSGERAIRVGAVGRKNGYGGVVQILPVDPKKRYTFRVQALNNESEPMAGGSEVLLIIEWRNEAGVEISRSVLRPIGSGLSRKQWKELELSAHPPRQAVRGKFVVQLREDKQPGEGSVFFDDVEIIER